MSLVIRKVEKRALWDRRNSEPRYLENDDLAADALSDLRTQENSLSVYFVEPGDAAMLERLIAALAAGRQQLDKVDYIAFDPNLLDELGIKVVDTRGGLPDDQANQWHRDLIELSAKKIADLGHALKKHGDCNRIRPEDVKRLIQHGVDSKQIDYSRLQPYVAKHVVAKS